MAEADTYGDNRTLAERFSELNGAIKASLTNQHADLMEREQNLIDECALGIPDAIADDEAEKAGTDLGARINTFLLLVEGQRIAQEEAEQLERERRAAEEEARRRAQEAADAQAAAQAKTTMTKADSGAMSGQTGTWKAEIVDAAAIDFNELRPFFTAAEIAKAANAYARHHKGGRPIPGLRMFEDFTTTFRGG